jgi:histidyl-tRNA synthetase
VKKNFQNKRFVQKDLISQTHEALLVNFKDMEKAKYYGLATQKKRTKLIIESLFDLKRCYSDAQATYYNFSEIDYDTFLGENGIEKSGK